jgi:hypothetical protein
VEELGQDDCAVLRRDDPGQLEHDRDAQLAFPERLDHLGVPLDEVRRHLPVMGGTPGQPQLPVEEVEEMGVAKLHPEPAPVKLGQRQQEIGHGATSTVKEIGETSGRFACLVHARMFLRRRQDHRCATRWPK